MIQFVDINGNLLSKKNCPDHIRVRVFDKDTAGGGGSYIKEKIVAWERRPIFPYEIKFNSHKDKTIFDVAISVYGYDMKLFQFEDEDGDDKITDAHFILTLVDLRKDNLNDIPQSGELIYYFHPLLFQPTDKEEEEIRLALDIWEGILDENKKTLFKFTQGSSFDMGDMDIEFSFDFDILEEFTDFFPPSGAYGFTYFVDPILCFFCESYWHVSLDIFESSKEWSYDENSLCCKFH